MIVAFDGVLCWLTIYTSGLQCGWFKGDEGSILSCRFLAEETSAALVDAAENEPTFISSIILSYGRDRRRVEKCTKYIARTDWAAFVQTAASFPRLQQVTIRAAQDDVGALTEHAYLHLELLAREHLVKVVVEESG